MYKIIICNNGKRHKLINTYKTYSNAISAYRRLLKENIVYFPKEVLWDGVETNYELVLTAPPKNKKIDFIKNEYGEIVRLKSKGNFSIKKVSKYKIEDVFMSRITGKKYRFKELMKDFGRNNNLTHVITILQNKLVIEYFENDNMDVLILKNSESAYRLGETIKQFNIINGIGNFIYFLDPTFDTKLKIYDALEDRYGVSRKYMQKVTTH